MNIDQTEEEVLSGDSVSLEDFIAEMEERGLIVPGPPTPWNRFLSLLKAPFRFISGVLAWVSWSLYGRIQYKIALKKSIYRWRQLAGLERDPRLSPAQWEEHCKNAAAWKRKQHEEIERINSEKPSGWLAESIHKSIIRNTVILPPAPDIDDTGIKK